MTDWTDLAVEATQLWQERSAGVLDGVRQDTRERLGFAVTEVEVLNQEGAQAVGKPVGRYLTLDTGPRPGRAADFLSRLSEAIAVELRALLSLRDGESVLVVGLGNRSITPDAVGPWAVDQTVVTRHLVRALPDSFGQFRSVSALATGVLGTTGVESGELVKALCEQLQPGAVIAVDALAARSAQRLCTTVQLSDTGIVPGSGVGNARFALTEESLGRRVIAVGVPTVIRGAVLCADLGGTQEEQQALGELFVTPKDIDSAASELSRAIGWAVSMAVQEDLSLAEVQALLGG
jgi:spore protease